QRFNFRAQLGKTLICLHDERLFVRLAVRGYDRTFFKCPNERSQLSRFWEVGWTAFLEKAAAFKHRINAFLHFLDAVCPFGVLPERITFRQRNQNEAQTIPYWIHCFIHDCISKKEQSRFAKSISSWGGCRFASFFFRSQLPLVDPHCLGEPPQQSECRARCLHRRTLRIGCQAKSWGIRSCRRFVGLWIGTIAVPSPAAPSCAKRCA